MQQSVSFSLANKARFFSKPALLAWQEKIAEKHVQKVQPILDDNTPKTDDGHPLV